jgi:hypothetical protein
MLKSLPVLRSPNLWVWIPVLLFAAGDLAGAEDMWFRSNAAGMTLERSLSRFAALRNKYALSVAAPEVSELPEYLRPYHDPSFTIELHTLYEDGIESRRQWIFRDERGITRLVSSGDLLPNPSGEEDTPAGGGDAASGAVPAPGTGEDEDGAGTSPPEDDAVSETVSFFIEIYDENNLITEEHQLSGETSEYITRFFYRDMILVRAETHLRETGSEGEDEKVEPLTTDYYRYSRSKSLRAVERIYHQPLPEDNYRVRLSFPHLILNAAMDKDFVSPGTAYGSEFLQDMPAAAGNQVSYTTDERGRILVETTTGEGGELIGEIRNTWSDDRLVSVEWKSPGEERRNEYEYDQEGDRIAERNYRNGVLERVVRREGDREAEELYMNGVIILRAIWEGGRKISEEYFNLQRREENW